MEGPKTHANVSDLLKEELLSNSDSLPSNTKEEEEVCEEPKEVTMDEIMKELRIVRQQNTITHCLLSVLIVVTAVWQFSEVFMILNVKKKITHPFQTIKSFFRDALRLGGPEGAHGTLLSPSIIPQLDGNAMSGLPELPQVDLLSAVSGDGSSKE